MKKSLEEIKPIRSAGIVIFDKDKVLMVEHTQKAGNEAGVMGLPAGRLEPNEKDNLGALRELTEETGLTAKPEDLVELPTKYYAEIKRSDGTKLYSYTVFYCKKYTGKLNGNEENIPRWIPIANLYNYNLLVNVEKAINQALEYTKKL